MLTPICAACATTPKNRTRPHGARTGFADFRAGGFDKVLYHRYVLWGKISEVLSMKKLQIKLLMRAHGLTETQANALAFLIWGAC